MSPYEAMIAWADGEIRTREAMRITGSDTIYDLIGACASSGVSLESELTEREERQIEILSQICEPL